MIRADDEYRNAVDFFLEWEKQIREKAIDDFVNACKSNTLCQTFGLRQCDIEEIAEKLKDGVENEQSI